MVRSTWIAWGLLVGVFGLISDSAFAAVSRSTHIASPPTQTQAQLDCLDAAINVSEKFPQQSYAPFGPYSSDFQLTSSCDYVTTSGRVDFPSAYQCGFSYLYKASPTATPYKRYGACGAKTQNSWSVQCSNLGGVTCDTQVSNYAFNSANVCENVEDFESLTMRAPTANGTGNVCSAGCSYNVSIGYSGTWPAGHVFFTFTSNNRPCEPGEGTPTQAPIDDDTPLDIPGETPDTGPDPSDGSVDNPEGEASGGGTCDSPPVCSGNSVQCNQLYQQWAIRCQSNGGGGEGPGEGTDLTGVEDRLDTLIEDNRDAWRGEIGPGSDGDFGAVKGVKTWDSSDLDTSGLGFARSCNMFQNLSIPVGGGVIEVDFTTAGVCDIFIWSGYLVVALASFLGCLILIKD